ncbi:unnamed protein product [Enterobius vermicularis]|uniref:ANK_REP_REGION domain-containing protein n=1 Tax=Enterobius vermicularis TaxID=51028 RepID=A0A0N4VAV3_ENTVE|nr:unnamed protein product [Enterobius vermicularis]
MNGYTLKLTLVLRWSRVQVHRKSDNGATPLHTASRLGEWRQCKKLIQDGAPVNATDFGGWTPLHEACARARFKVAKTLIGNGADVNAVSNTGDTPLHDAVRRGCEKLVWLLLHSGADRDRTDRAGKKPIDLCPARCVSIKSLLTSSGVPEKCPSGGDSTETSPVEHHVELRHPLSVTIDSPSMSASKQPTPSPAETEATVHSETCLQEEREQENLDSDIDRTMTREGEKQGMITEGSTADADSIKKTQDSNDVRSGDVAAAQKRAVWGNDEVTAAKNDEALEAEAEDGDQESGAQPEDESSGAEPRKWARTRGTPKKVPLGQEKQHVFTDRRKQRGRRRGKVTTASRSLVLPHPSTSEDIYEFRCSPEPEAHDNTQIEVTDENGISPDAKRQRLEGTYVHAQTAGPSVKQEEKRQIDLTETNKGGAGATESNEEGNGSRKVPPIRIILPRTASEENSNAVPSEEATSVAAGTRNGAKRNTRVAKNQIKKESTPEGPATPPPADNGMHRMTRSRVRQAGRSLKDEVLAAGCFESAVKRRGQNGARRQGNSSVPGAPSPMPVVEKEDNTDPAAADSGTFNSNANSSEDGNSVGSVDGLSAFAMSLMKKNTYEGLRSLRAKIEESWLETMAQQPPDKPELPSNYDSYLIVNKNFTLKDTVDYDRLMKACGAENYSEVSSDLQDLWKSQEERRLRMEIKHKVEREKLQMLAEREVLRMLNRKANSGREDMSTVRVLHETDIYNTWYVKERSIDHPIVEFEDVKKKFMDQVTLMENRQKMESDALFAEQVYTWNSLLKNISHPSGLALKDKVPKVSVLHLDLRL